jgi:hypothetical protein
MPQHSAVQRQSIKSTTEMILISDVAIPAVDAELRYHSDDPFAVQLLLSVDQGPLISWVFGRELLISGVNMPAGIGDVQVFPTHDGVIIELRAGDATARLLAHIPDVADFTERTLELVPLGTEMDHCDLDSGLGSLPIHDFEV